MTDIEQQILDTVREHQPVPVKRVIKLVSSRLLDQLKVGATAAVLVAQGSLITSEVAGESVLSLPEPISDEFPEADDQQRFVAASIEVSHNQARHMANLRDALLAEGFSPEETLDLLRATILSGAGR